MKKFQNLIPALTIGLLIFQGCGPSENEKNQKVTIDSLQRQLDTLDIDFTALKNLSLDAEPCTPTGPHEIDFEREAADYIVAFQKLFWGGSPNTDIKNGWTEIPIDYLIENFPAQRPIPATHTDEHCGLMLYFCKKGNEYYVAYTGNYQLNKHNDPFSIPNMSARLYKSNFSWKFKNFIGNHASMITELLKSPIQNDPAYPYSNDAYTRVEIPWTEVNKEANNFLIHILGANDTKQGILENPVGFFHHNQINRLITQPLPKNITFKGVRIYWAYKENDNNYIKLVAFAIMSAPNNEWDDKNYCYIDNDHEKGSAIILERSWPPD